MKINQRGKLRVFRKNLPGQDTAQPEEDKHILSINFGRFVNSAKLVHERSNIQNDFVCNLPTSLYFVESKESEDGYILSQYKPCPDAMPIDPFFDGQYDQISIGNEEYQYDIPLKKFTDIYVEAMIEKLNMTPEYFVQIVYTCFTTNQTYLDSLYSSLEGVCQQKNLTITIQNLITTEDLIDGYDTSVIIQKNNVTCNGQQLNMQGSQMIIQSIHDQALKIFGTTLYNNYVKDTLDENLESFNLSSLETTIHIPFDAYTVKSYCKNKHYTQLKQKKDRQLNLYCQTAKNYDLILIITKNAIIEAQSQFAHYLCKYCDLKYFAQKSMSSAKSQASNLSLLPKLTINSYCLLEQDTQFVNMQILMMTLGKILGFKYEICGYDQNTLIEFGLKKFLTRNQNTLESGFKRANRAKKMSPQKSINAQPRSIQPSPYAQLAKLHEEPQIEQPIPDPSPLPIQKESPQLLPVEEQNEIVLTDIEQLQNAEFPEEQPQTVQKEQSPPVIEENPSITLKSLSSKPKAKPKTDEKNQSLLKAYEVLQK